MYSIYSTTAGKTICIHDDSVADQSVKVLDPKLKLGDSNAGSLQFKIAPNNVAFGDYEYTETIATGIENVGSAIDLVDGSSLEQGSIDTETGQDDDTNQNEVRTVGYLSRKLDPSEHDVNTLSVSAIGAAAFSSVSVSTGISKDSRECSVGTSTTDVFRKGYIGAGTGERNSENQYYISTSERFIGVSVGDTVSVTGIYDVTQGIAFEIMCYDATGNFIGHSSRLSGGSTYTIVSFSGKSTAKIGINICRSGESPPPIDVKKVKNVYIYINGINFFMIKSGTSSNYNSITYKSFIHTDYIPVNGRYGRLYQKLFLNPLADIADSAEQGYVGSDSSSYIIKEDSGETAAKNIRISANQAELTGIYTGALNPVYLINVENSTDKRMIIRVYYYRVNDGVEYHIGDGETPNYTFYSDDENKILNNGSPTFCDNIWVDICYEDGSDIAPSELTKFELLFDPAAMSKRNIYISATIGLYFYENGIYNYIGDGYPLSDDATSGADIFNKYVDLDYYVASKNKTANYISITYSIQPLTGFGPINRVLTVNDISDIKVAVGETIIPRIYQYDNNSNFLDANDIDRLGSVSLDPLCDKYRIAFHLTRDAQVTVQSIESAEIQRYGLNTKIETKKIDPLSRLTSTITVKRSTWGYSRLPNIGESGSVNVISTNNITGLFEQGTIDSSGSDWSSGYFLRTSAIPMALVAGDYISVDASITESDTTVDGSSSSTVRRPIYFKVHFYSGSIHSGFVDNIAGGGDCIVPSNLSQYPITSIRIVIWGSDGAPLNLQMLDYAKLYSTRSSVFGADVTPCTTVIDGVSYSAGDLVPNEYTVTSKELELKMTANTSVNTYTAQIEAQSRQGIGFFWGIAMYDASHNYIGMFRWLDQLTRFDGILNETKYIRIILKYKTDLTQLDATELPPNDISVLNVMCTRYARTRTEEEIWEGRVLSEDADFKKCRVIYCEGELAYLNDTRQPPRVYENSSFRNYISKLIEIHNSKVSDSSYYELLETMPIDWEDSYTNYYLRTGSVGNYTYTRLTQDSPHTWDFQLYKYCKKINSTKRFVLGTTWEPTKKKGEEWDTPDPNEDISRHVTNFETTLECLNNLVNDYGGHLRVRKVAGNRYIDWLEDYPTKSNQVINFGSNLLDFTKKFDLSKLCTAVYPTGEVLVSAKSSAVGDHVSKESGKWSVYENTLLYQNEDDGKIYMNSNPNLQGYLTVIATVETSTVSSDGSGDKSYYFSGRLHGGFVAYWVTDDAGNFYNGGIEIAGDERPDTGFIDYVDHKITMPPGANKIWMCSFGSAIPLALKTETKETTGLDEVLTITDCATDKDFSTGKIWHTKGSPYITNPDSVTKYGWIEHRLDLSNLKDKDALYSAAKTYLQKGQFEEMTLEVSAIDLNSLGVDTDYINLLDKVRCVSDPHGLDQEFPVTELEIPLNDPANQKFRLGNKNEVNLSTQAASTNTELLQKIEKVPSSESVIRTALQTAASSIANATGGSYINYRYDDDGHPIEMIISEEAPTIASDPTTIPNGSTWRWNRAGLAHSNGGYDPVQFADDANLAITEDGRVIANEILGQFILGYTIGGTKLVIGDGLGVTPSEVQAWLPRIQGIIPSCLSVVDSAANPAYIDLYKGIASFGKIDTSQTPVSRTETGRINGNINVVTGNVTKRVLVIESQGTDGVIDLNADQIWVGIGEDGFDNVAKAYSGYLYASVPDGEGGYTLCDVTDYNGSRVEVRNGLILSNEPL